VSACIQLNLRLKLVTLPYLIPDNARNHPNVEVLQRLPYDKLFELYANAASVVVPLKEGISYPSGIRAVLEALALNKAAIVTRTPVLEEYFHEGDGELL